MTTTLHKRYLVLKTMSRGLRKGKKSPDRFAVAGGRFLELLCAELNKLPVFPKVHFLNPDTLNENGLDSCARWASMEPVQRGIRAIGLVPPHPSGNGWVEGSVFPLEKPNGTISISII
jgi:hypothetical protein